jgi:ABC-type Fe3+-hydroxamate transport system substrate-binding protein
MSNADVTDADRIVAAILSAGRLDRNASAEQAVADYVDTLSELAKRLPEIKDIQPPRPTMTVSGEVLEKARRPAPRRR